MKNTFENLNKYNKTIFWASASFLFILTLVYGFSLNTTIQNVVERGRIEQKISKLNTQIAELEYSYVSEKNKVTLDLAYSLGFKKTANISFVGGKSSQSGLSLGN